MFDIRQSVAHINSDRQESNFSVCLFGELAEGKIFYNSRTLAALVPFSATVECNIIANSLKRTNPVTASYNNHFVVIPSDPFRFPAIDNAFDAKTPGITTVALFKIYQLIYNIETEMYSFLWRISRMLQPVRYRRVRQFRP